MALGARCPPVARCLRNKPCPVSLRRSAVRPAAPRASHEASPPSDEDGRTGDAPASENPDWRSFRARLVQWEARVEGEESGDAAAPDAVHGLARPGVQHWAHALPGPEPGCLLLANPLLFLEQQRYFRRAAVLLYDHDELGSAGIILTRPTEHTVGNVAGCGALLPEFTDARLHLGGDVNLQVLHILHPPHASLATATTICPGLALGGFSGAAAAVRRGDLPASDFKVRSISWWATPLLAALRSAAAIQALTRPHPSFSYVSAGGARGSWRRRWLPACGWWQPHHRRWYFLQRRRGFGSKRSR